MRTLVTRRPVVAFFAIAYVISWAIWVPLVVKEEASTTEVTLFIMAGAFGPPVPALIVTWIAEGWDGVRRWAGRIVRWQVGLGWYLVALFGVLVLDYLAFGLYLLLGGVPSAGWQPQP
jgi:hypothetical protein